jgi:DNA polymerase (family 10)
VENVEIAAVLDEVADLLDIQGENPFRVRAYRNAVRTIRNLTRPLSEMLALGEDLKELPGVGVDIAGYIAELLETGHLKRLQQLESKVPAGVVELMRIPGVGPKRARLLYDALGIRSLSDLKRAVAAGEVEELKGFGPKTVASIRRGLRESGRGPVRVRLADADQFVHALLAYMRASPDVKRIEAAGSYRRRQDTVGDIDLLAVGGEPGLIMQRFTSFPDVARVPAAGRIRGTVILKSGLQVDLRIVTAAAYGSALQYLTGSKAHSIAVRALAVKRGLRISEYGVFRRATAGASGRRIGGTEESDVYDAVSMAWVPPELRENRGEVEAALAHELPRLIEPRDIRGDLQMHSTWSDGNDSIETMAFAALARGYQYICITDHSRAVTVAHGLGVTQLKRQRQEITTVRRKLHGRMHLLHGVEVDILRDGTLDLPDADLHRLDVVIASVHSHMTLAKTAMTERVLSAIAHPAVDILGHPTGRVINERAPYQLDVEAVLRAAREHDVAVELNAQPYRLDLTDIWVRRAKQLGVRVAINTDAHTAASLEFMRYGVDQARRGWLEPQDVLNTLSLPALLAWLHRRRSPPVRAGRMRLTRTPATAS